jgi:hypothetical protein
MCIFFIRQLATTSVLVLDHGFTARCLFTFFYWWCLQIAGGLGKQEKAERSHYDYDGEVFILYRHCMYTKD